MADFTLFQADMLDVTWTDEPLEDTDPENDILYEGPPLAANEYYCATCGGACHFYTRQGVRMNG